MGKITPILAAWILLLTAATCHAGEGRGYLGGQVGMFLPIESSVTGTAGLSGKLTYDPGIVLAAVGGYEFGNGIRSEAELNFRHLTVDKFHSGTGKVAVDSDIWCSGFMTNLYYDFNNLTRVTPYLGAGVGMAVVDFGKGTSKGATLWTSDREVTVAYQGIAGFAVRLGSRTSLDFVYHHYAAPTLHFDTLSAQFRGLNLSAGVRHWF